MSLENSIKHLHWKCSQANASIKDRQAIDEVIEWINREKKKTIQQNQLFAKLYICHFGELMIHFKDISFAQKELHKLLSESTINHVEWFRKKFNLIHQNKALKKMGLSATPWYILEKPELKKEDDLIQENQELFLGHLNKWNIELIQKSLDNQITDAYNLYKDYK